jgi:FdhD protein
MMRSKITSVSVQRVQGEDARPSRNSTRDASQDFVAVEEPLQIRLDDRDLAITMRTPGEDRELAVGFLFTEGLIESVAEIARIEDDTHGSISIALVPQAGRASGSSRNFYMTSSCGVCGKASVESLHAAGCTPLTLGGLRIDARLLASLPECLRREQMIFERTGGLHAAGLFDQTGALIDVREDVGRHNAVDKLIGSALLADRVPLDAHILMLSGRVSFELVQKALRARIPVIAAIGAPSSLAVETARRFSITLAGFVRDERFNLYAGQERIRQPTAARAE